MRVISQTPNTQNITTLRDPSLWSNQTEKYGGLLSLRRVYMMWIWSKTWIPELCPLYAAQKNSSFPISPSVGKVDFSGFFPNGQVELLCTLIELTSLFRYFWESMYKCIMCNA